MDFIDKKEKLADLIELYIKDENNKEELIGFVEELSSDNDFKNKDLFHNLFGELLNYFDDLSKKELKQRVLLIRSYID
jgi:hypothetical protein